MIKNSEKEEEETIKRSLWNKWRKLYFNGYSKN